MTFPVLDAARTIIRAELDLYHAQHGHPRPVTICDLTSGYDAAMRVLRSVPGTSPGDDRDPNDAGRK